MVCQRARSMICSHGQSGIGRIVTARKKKGGELLNVRSIRGELHTPRVYVGGTGLCGTLGLTRAIVSICT